VDLLLGQLDGQTRIADRVFPSPTESMLSFTRQVLNTVLFDYTTQLIDRTRQGNDTEIYLKVVVGAYHQCRRLALYLNKPSDAANDFRDRVSALVDALFEPHIEGYLRVELEHYRKCCDSVVDSWKKKVKSQRSG
jgi:Exocyst complex component Sec10